MPDVTGGAIRFVAIPEELPQLRMMVDNNNTMPIVLNGGYDPTSPMTVPITNSFGLSHNYKIYWTANVLNGSVPMRLVV